MALLNINPLLEAEPYEMTQGPRQAASPQELKAFYQDMERKDLERKLSKRNSKTHSLWSRKSLKRSGSNPGNVAAQIPSGPEPPLQPPPPPPQNASAAAERLIQEANELVEEQKDKAMELRSNFNATGSSLVPDPLTELPAWYNKDSWSNGSMSHKVRFPIHNPVGPRWYRNYHLIPPSHRQRSARPPSVFSPSFPPMAFSSTQQEQIDEYRAGPSRTPSGSPLPTPNSSQTKVEETAGKRSRKTSQTAHDNVDMLDVSDPWGTNWHHQSPYDIGLGNGPVSVDIHENRNQSRSRLSSMGTSQSRHRSVVPSPLSQSTSAVHLHVPDHDSIRLPRKLSKRRAPTVGSIFSGGGPPPDEPERNAISLPTTPTEHPPIQAEPPAHGMELSRRTSNLNSPGLPPSSASQVSGKKAKRGSVLGRIVKKFSILKGRTDKHETNDNGTTSNGADARKSFVVGRQASPERPPIDPRRHTEPAKRVPPPAEHEAPAPEPPVNADSKKPTGDRTSLASIDMPYWGRLTITNPDAPSSETNTPVQRDAPLPPEKHDSDGHHHQQNSSVTSPPPAPSPAFMSLPVEQLANSGLSVPSLSTVSPDQPSPLLPPIPAPSPGPPPTPDKEFPPKHSPYQEPPQFSSTTSLPTIPSPSPGTPAQIPFPSPPFMNGSLMVGSPMTIPSQFDYSDSPLSSVSMLANPGTPYNPEMSMPPSIAPPPIALHSSSEGSPLAREVQPDGSDPRSSQATRETETFKLVRSASGNVYASTDTIQGGGEQWEVVESKRESRAKDGSRDRQSKSKAKDRDREKEREREREKEREREREKEKEREREERRREREAERERERVKEKERERQKEKEKERQREKERAREKEREKEKEKEREREKEKERKERERVREKEKEKEREREKEKEKERSKDKSREKDSERDSRREKRRLEKEKPSKESSSSSHHDKRPSRHRSAQEGHGSSHSSRHAKTYSLEVNVGTDASSSRKEERTSRRRDGDEKDRKADRKHSPPEGGKLQHVTSSSTRRLERANSTSTRPTSELPPTADLNALRAREAWEMDRLWKARSMYGSDPNNLAPAPSSIASATSYMVTEATTHGAVHGSSHTAFMVPTPFQHHPHGHIYNSMPNGPAPIIYAAPHGAQYQVHPHQYPHSHSYPQSYTSSDTLSLPPASRSNPLPEPPRESTIILDHNGRPTEYWTKYTGVTTAH